MNFQKKSSRNQHYTSADKALVDAWHKAQVVVDAERLRRLRSMSEQDAARQFARLLQIGIPYPLRPSSGLVEQQRQFACLRALL